MHVPVQASGRWTTIGARPHRRHPSGRATLHLTMEINPSLARMRILELQDGVQMQREAAPDDELAGCPGCPYFWTCPVPHRAGNVAAPEEIDLADVADQVPGRAAFRPRDADDIGWTDTWEDADDSEDVRHDGADSADGGVSSSEADAGADGDAEASPRSGPDADGHLTTPPRRTLRDRLRRRRS